MPADILPSSTRLMTPGTFCLIEFEAQNQVQVLFLPSTDFADLPTDNRIAALEAVKVVCDQFIENARNPPPPREEMS